MQLELSFKSILFYIGILVILVYLLYIQSKRDIIIYPKDIYTVKNITYCRDSTGIIYKVTGSLIEKKSNQEIIRVLKYNINKDVLVRVSGYSSPYYIIGPFIINIENQDE